jgi:hypothetical protein
MKFVGTLAPHPRPKFGVLGRVAIADAQELAIRDRIVQLLRQRSDAYKNLAQSGMATRARFLKLEHANETCGEGIGRTAL